MTCFWWQLPNPNLFIDRVVQDLRDGKNVILRLPEHLPDGLSNAIQSGLGEGWDWHNISVREENVLDPVHFLFEHFVGEINPNEIRNARTLAQHENFSGKIIGLDGLTPELWPAWKKFLSDYDQPCRNIPKLYRTLFCVSLVGELALDPPEEDVSLSHQIWKGIVDRLDMMLFTSGLFQGKKMSDLQKRVAISVVTNLGLWDYEVSERLADEKIDNILKPFSVLEEIAAERQWFDLSHNLSETWCKGMTNLMEFEEKIHSAVLVDGVLDKTEIERRIWSGEVGELLPFVEQRRHDLLKLLDGVLKVPFRTKFGEVIEDVKDLEIGHIEYQITEPCKRVKPDVQHLVRHLKAIRNSLSHLEIINPEILSCREMTNWHQILKQ